ncbi:CDP-diacylglycerol--glycerol-3-phosphate 3-phosphatidyltransferase [Arthrobacter sp.]|uniref:CDP-diacylglycerol--glycerol-3-phosphate 3-phosphatidyltransferase n=1 Tax=Arthrobacter sp. TaxID=1667 RepID=UPI003A8F03F2
MTETPVEPDPQPVPTLNIANVLTTLRIIMVPFFVWALVADDQQHGVLRWVAVALFALAMYTDKLDGDLARSRGLITNFGKIADPIADKLLLGAALVTLSWLGELWWWVTIVILVRELGITALRFAVIRRGVIAASRGGKIKTVTQTAGLFLMLLPFTPDIGWLTVLALAVILLAAAITVYTGIDYIVQAARMKPAPDGREAA